jgi:hypothetical protein
MIGDPTLSADGAQHGQSVARLGLRRLVQRERHTRASVETCVCPQPTCLALPRLAA